MATTANNTLAPEATTEEQEIQAMLDAEAKAEADRLAAEQAEQERLMEEERLAAEAQAEADRIAAEQAAAQKAAEEQAEQDRLAAEAKAAQDKADAEAAAQKAATHALESTAEIHAAIAAAQKAGVTTAGINAIQQILRYIDAMSPRKPLTVEDGCRHQTGLYRSLLAIFNRLPQSDFKPVFDIVLGLFEEHKDGALNEIYVFRFMEDISLGDSDRKAFQRILNMIKVAAPVKGRELALKQVNLDATLKFGFTEEGRQRVLAYFNK